MIGVGGYDDKLVAALLQERHRLARQRLNAADVGPKEFDPEQNAHGNKTSQFAGTVRF